MIQIWKVVPIPEMEELTFNQADSETHEFFESNKKKTESHITNSIFYVSGLKEKMIYILWKNDIL